MLVEHVDYVDSIRIVEAVKRTQNRDGNYVIQTVETKKGRFWEGQSPYLGYISTEDVKALLKEMYLAGHECARREIRSALVGGGSFC